MRTQPSGNRHLRLFAILLAGLIVVLGAGYYLFLRTDYAVLFSEVRPADASAIVAELERQNIGHQLRDGGTTILVPAAQVAAAQVAIAGSEVPQRGMVGFELFNESDMGLTDFAQRVNYQRALQGEIARTIMQMDGIEHARVHLALPERSLFRGNRSQPRAAVTVMPKRGRLIDDARVAGIQRLTAAAIPDLALEDVVVLDNLGRVISPVASPDDLMSPEVEEQSAVQRYFRGRARAAVSSVLPDLEFDVRVVTASRLSGGSSGWNAPPAERRPAQEGAARDFQLRILVLTRTPLAGPDQALARNAIANAVALDEAAGDSIAFNVAPVGPVAAAPPMADRLPAVEVPTGAERNPAEDGAFGYWWLLLAALAGVGATILALRLRSGALAPEQRAAFVLRIRRQLNLAGEGVDG